MARTKSPLPAEPKIEDITVIIDDQEKVAADIAPFKWIEKHLRAGDYSIVGLENVIAIERKSKVDFLNSMSGERDRFEWQIKRLVAFPVRALVVEMTWDDIEQANWRHKITAASAMGTLLGIIAHGVPVVMAGDHDRAGIMISRILYIAARRRWREARALVASTTETQEKEKEGNSTDA